MTLEIRDLKVYVPAKDATASGCRTPEKVDESLVLHMVDPSGVLLDFVQ